MPLLASGNRRRSTFTAGSLLALAFAACADKEPAKGQLVLALQTDLALPKDIDTVRIQVRANGVSRFDRSYPFGGPNENKIPATLTLVGGDDPKQSIEVRVLAFRQGEIRTLSKTITTIPEERTAMLRVPIQWFCYRQAEASGDDEFRSTCEADNGPESACFGGTCVDANVAASELPDFEPEVVFGGGDSASDPDAECFATEACFDAGLDVVPDEHCVVTLPDSSADRVNFAVVTEGAGICSSTSGACYVPLDRAPELGGWSELADGGEVPRYTLPQAVCERLADGRGLRLRATEACAAKTPSRPTCGEWSSVTAPADDLGAAGASGVAGAGNGDGEGGEGGGASGGGGETAEGGSGGTSAIAGGGGLAGSSQGGSSQGGSSQGGAFAGGVANGGRGGAGGSGGATAGSTSTAGVGGGGGTGGEVPGFCEAVPEFAIPIDDLEDGDNRLLSPRDGEWFAYSDGTSSDLTPPVDVFLPTYGEGASSSYAAALSGSGFTNYGAGIGFTLDREASLTCTYDARQYSGLQFQYRSDTPLHVLVLDDQRTPPLCSGDCFGNAFQLPSSVEFTLVEVTFDELNLGTPEGELDRSRVTQIRFQAPVDTPFDFAVDDLAFTQLIGQ